MQYAQKQLFADTLKVKLWFFNAVKVLFAENYFLMPNVYSYALALVHAALPNKAKKMPKIIGLAIHFEKNL